MIFVERPAAPVPLPLRNERARQAAARASKYFQTPLHRRRQKLYSFDREVYLHSHVRRALGSLFNHKCAYCETPLDGEIIVSHFRPTSGAVGLENEYSADDYWWLAYKWENLYAACSSCNNFKGSKFPVEGKRARVHSTPAELVAERRFIIDPCRDQPEEHLDFAPDGRVIGRTPHGQMTITILNLNRDELVALRRTLVEKVLDPGLKTLKDMFASHPVWLPPDPQEDLAETMRWIAWQWRSFVKEPRERSLLNLLLEALMPESPFLAVSREWFRRWLVNADFAFTSSSSSSLSNVPTFRQKFKTLRRAKQARRKIATRRIIGIQIRNFRGIGKLDIDCSAGKPNAAPWTMFLGENSAGKSSILQGVALVLMTTSQRDASGIKPASVLRQGTKRGSIKLLLSSRPREIELTFSARGRFKSSVAEPNLVLLGYGATRLLPRPPRSLARRNSGFVRVKNLFDPFVPLLNARKWLWDQSRQAFDFTARAIKDMLTLGQDIQLVRSVKSEEGVLARIRGKRIPLAALSDGYQSVIGLTADLIKGLRANHEGGLETAEGVVLLDEIGAHLHPRWRLSIVPSLRKAFPRVQFLASTHDPLCLRGLDREEVKVLRRDRRGRVFIFDDLPPAQGMSAEALLTSEYFGLFSTLDHQTEKEFEEYYLLLASASPNNKRLRELRTKLTPLQVPGTSRRERLLLRIIDQYLALEQQDPRKLTPEAVERLIRQELLRSEKSLGQAHTVLA